MLKCAWCMKKLKSDKAVYAINVKFAEGKEISDPDGRIMFIPFESRNTKVQILISGDGSPSENEGIDGSFPICSEKCGEKMRAALAKEMGTFVQVSA